MRARCRRYCYYFTESEPRVGKEKRMDASDYRWRCSPNHRWKVESESVYNRESNIAGGGLGAWRKSSFSLSYRPFEERHGKKSIITRLRLDRTVLQYPSIWKASILVLCSYPLSTPSPSFSSINPTASLHSSLLFQPLAS